MFPFYICLYYSIITFLRYKASIKKDIKGPVLNKVIAIPIGMNCDDDINIAIAIKLKEERNITSLKSNDNFIITFKFFYVKVFSFLMQICYTDYKLY